jgi:monovalent cation:H+ antiporter-2, CPA2 family
MDGLLLLQDFAVVLLVAGAVGLLFRRLGLSVVVGYLVAGMIVGPFTPPFSLVSDVERVQTVSQIGLVFLMFFVGLGLNLQRLRELGFPVALATAVTAFLVFYACQAFAGIMGWDANAALVFSGMFMVSSSAIITKVLAERGLTQESFAQRATGVTVMEDVVAVTMLTLISARLGSAGSEAGGAIEAMGVLLVFVVLSLVAGLLMLPRLLQRYSKPSDSDLKVVLVVGLLFLSAIVAVWAGFSLALGAFLMGVVAGGTASRRRIERSLLGTQELFAAVFFVSIGMLIDVRVFLDHAGLILVVAAFILFTRMAAATAGQILGGRPLHQALRTGLTLTPIGEFSFIMAQLGAASGEVPEVFYALAVGVSLITAISTPMLVRHSGAIADWADAGQPAGLRRFLDAYAGGWQLWQRRQDQVIWWKLVRGRLIQVAMEILLMAGTLVFAPRLMNLLQEWSARTGFSPPGWTLVFWTVVGLVALLLGVAAWRNLSAMSLIFAEALNQGSARTGRLKQICEGLFQMAAAVVLALVLWMSLPDLADTLWDESGFMVFFLVVGVLFWRRLVRWHSHLQISLKTAMEVPAGTAAGSGRVAKGAERIIHWGASLQELEIPEQSEVTGKTLAEIGLRSELGCSVVEIIRQGHLIAAPGPDEKLYPGDRVHLFGPPAALAEGKAFLNRPRLAESEGQTSRGMGLEEVRVPTGSPRAGKTLGELRVFAETGVQVLACRRGERVVTAPPAGEELQDGDHLLIAATPAMAARFEKWLMDQ